MDSNLTDFLEQLLEISRMMAENREPDGLLHYAMQAAMELVNARQGHLILLQEDGTLTFRVSHGTPDEISHSVLNRVLNKPEPLWIGDALGDKEFGNVASVRGYLLRSIMCVPLISRDRLLGAVYVENRSLANAFQDIHLEVLIFFAKQAAVLIENAMLAGNLQQAREQLVTAREEERRRLRRDLHDGLGPSLAALRLQLEAARNLAWQNRETSAALLEEIKGDIDYILTDIRRIVYELRPPALDEFGLVSALQEYIATCERNSDLHLEISAPATLPPLPAAVEVAIYRIVLEAITNVIRHAYAQHCLIRLSVDQMVHLDIQDNGRGMPAKIQAGVGLTSMRERVGELGGTLQITSQTGTHLQVKLPLLR